MFIERCANIENLMQSTAPSSLSIRDLVIELVKMCDTHIVKLSSRDTCMYMKPSAILFFYYIILFYFIRTQTLRRVCITRVKCICCKGKISTICNRFTPKLY